MRSEVRVLEEMFCGRREEGGGALEKKKRVMRAVTIFIFFAK